MNIINFIVFQFMIFAMACAISIPRAYAISDKSTCEQAYKNAKPEYLDLGQCKDDKVLELIAEHGASIITQCLATFSKIVSENVDTYCNRHDQLEPFAEFSSDQVLECLNTYRALGYENWKFTCDRTVLKVFQTYSKKTVTQCLSTMKKVGDLNWAVSCGFSLDLEPFTQFTPVEIESCLLMGRANHLEYWQFNCDILVLQAIKSEGMSAYQECLEKDNRAGGKLGCHSTLDFKLSKHFSVATIQLCREATLDFVSGGSTKQPRSECQDMLKFVKRESTKEEAARLRLAQKTRRETILNFSLKNVECESLMEKLGSSNGPDFCEKQSDFRDFLDNYGLEITCMLMKHRRDQGNYKSWDKQFELPDSMDTFETNITSAGFLATVPALRDPECRGQGSSEQVDDSRDTGPEKSVLVIPESKSSSKKTQQH